MINGSNRQEIQGGSLFLDYRTDQEMEDSVVTKRHHPGRIACAAVCAAGLAPCALAARAAAATIAATQACYVNPSPSQGAPMTITGAGFTPGAPVNVFGGTANANSTASGSGAFAVSTSAPILDTTAPATALTTLTATDEADGATATTTVRSANLAVSVTPQSVSHLRTTKVRYRFSGFTPGKRIFAYYIRKKVVARSEFGKATGPCGTLQQKALLYPGGHPAHDKYTVTFESTSRYSRTADPRVTTSLTILRF